MHGPYQESSALFGLKISEGTSAGHIWGPKSRVDSESDPGEYMGYLFSFLKDLYDLAKKKRSDSR